MSTLIGKPLFITGASRGIGKAIALRAAADGASVVIAAKTVTPHPKLPGTIHTAAEEIEAAGGRALPVPVDVRFEDRIAAAAPRGRGGGGGGGRQGPACPRRRALRGPDRRRGRAGRGDVRRDRHPGEQRQRHQSHRDACDADEAVRPDVRRQRARDLRLLPGLHPVPSEVHQPAHPDHQPPPGHGPEMVPEPLRLYDGEIRDEHVRPGDGRGVPRGGDRRQRPVAPDRDRHGGGRDAGRGGRPFKLPKAGDRGRRGPRDPHARQPNMYGELLHRRGSSRGGGNYGFYPLCVRTRRIPSPGPVPRLKKAQGRSYNFSSPRRSLRGNAPLRRLVESTPLPGSPFAIRSFAVALFRGLGSKFASSEGGFDPLYANPYSGNGAQKRFFRIRTEKGGPPCHARPPSSMLTNRREMMSTGG